MGSVSKYFSSLENRTGTKFIPKFFFSAVRIKNLDFGYEKLLWWKVSQNTFLDLTILGAKKNFTPEIFRPKSALKSVPDFFFLEITSLPRTEKVWWNPTLTTQTNLATKQTPTEQMMELNSNQWNVVVYMDLDWRNVVVYVDSYWRDMVGWLLCGGDVANCDQNSKLYGN